MIHRLLLTGAAAALALAAGPASATTALSGSVAQRARAVVGENSGVDDSHQASWTGAIPASKQIATSAHARHEIGQDAFDAHSAVLAQWNSADSGFIDITDHGWSLQGADPGQQSQLVELNVAEGGVADWTYSFTASGFGDFTFASHFVGGGTDTTGLGSWALLFAEEGGFADVIRLHDGLTPTTDDTGFVSRALTAGRTYHVTLISDEGLFRTGTNVPRAASETAHFDWGITGSGGTDGGAVPEPSTWALAITGFGLAGAALRRRRTILA